MNRRKLTTKRQGQRITINSDGSASLEGVRCKNFEAAVRLADMRRRADSRSAGSGS